MPVRLSELGIGDSLSKCSELCYHSLKNNLESRMNAYSEDLRIKVINYLESGHTQEETSALFGVCKRSIVSWLKLKETTGSLKAVSTPRTPHKLHDKDVLEYVKSHADAYLREIGAYFKCCNAAIYKALKRLGVTRKKKHLV
jgi:transposase